MTTDAFIKIAGSVITIVITLIGIYIIPAIKARMTKDDMDTIAYYIDLAVRCAEQIYTKEQWKDKKDYVKRYIANIVNSKLNIKLTEDDIDTLIEGAVHELHNN